MTDDKWALTPDEEADVLQFDPWGERDATYRQLRASFVVVRKLHRCDICFGDIAVGDRVWAKTEQDDGKVATFRFCPECCWCIAHRLDESDDEYGFGWVRVDERWETGRSRADEGRTTR